MAHFIEKIHPQFRLIRGKPVVVTYYVSSKTTPGFNTSHSKLHKNRLLIFILKFVWLTL